MAQYTYKCQCGQEITKICKYEDRPLKVDCHVCGEMAIQVVSRTAPPQFNGQGFHCNDYPSQK